MSEPCTTTLRAFLLDSARTCASIDQFKNELIFLSKRKIDIVLWHFCDDQGCRIRFEGVPNIGSNPSYSVNETKEIVSFAKSLGIVLVPEVASLGHSRYITQLPAYRRLDEHDGVYSGMCPVHPDTRAVLTALIRETVEIFNPPAVHVGMDEVEIGQHPLTQQALRTRSMAQIIGDHILFLRQLIVETLGREMWMWGDGLLASPELLDLAPKDVVVCNWQYRPTADVSTTQRLLDRGFDMIVASALLSYEQPLFPSERYALENVRALARHCQLQSTGANGNGAGGRVRGHLVTTWIPSRSISNAQWLGWHLASEILSKGPFIDFEDAIRSFGREFFGLSDTGPWLGVCRVLLDLAPERPEWLPTIKLQIAQMSDSLKSVLAGHADQWRSAAKRLRTIRRGARKNLESFAALQLLFDLLSHAYEAAAYICKLEVDEPIDADEKMSDLIEQRSLLIARLSDAWDQERFPDDPAKTKPVIEFFRDEHLLFIVRDGLSVMTRRVGLVGQAPMVGE